MALARQHLTSWQMPYPATEGQQLYLQLCEPRRAATIVINDENLSSPEVVTAQQPFCLPGRPNRSSVELADYALEPTAEKPGGSEIGRQAAIRQELDMCGIPTEDRLPRDDRVVLTFFRLSDAEALRDLDADTEHRRRFEFPEEFVPSLEHSEKVIASWTRAREQGQFAFAVRALVNGDLLGGCEIRLLGNRVANLSYWTVPRHRAQGVASRAVALACQIAHAELGVELVEIVVDPDNVASRRVATRNGFREVGRRKGRILHVKEISTLPVDSPNNAIHAACEDGGA